MTTVIELVQMSAKLIKDNICGQYVPDVALRITKGDDISYVRVCIYCDLLNPLQKIAAKHIDMPERWGSE